mgnify:CR=1 FL=1
MFPNELYMHISVHTYSQIVYIRIAFLINDTCSILSSHQLQRRHYAINKPFVSVTNTRRFVVQYISHDLYNYTDHS